MCCSGKMLGPFGGNGGVEFDSGDFRAAGCHLGHISGKVGLVIIIIVTSSFRLEPFINEQRTFKKFHI